MSFSFLLRDVFVIKSFNNFQKEEIIYDEIIYKNSDEIINNIRIENNKDDDIEAACWSCGLYFTTDIWQVPITAIDDIEYSDQSNYEIHHNFPDSSTKKLIHRIKGQGNFCSEYCVVRYISESLEILPQNKNNCLNLLYLVYQQKTGRKVNYIPPSYPKNLMKLYRGPKGISEDEYKKKNDDLAILIT